MPEVSLPADTGRPAGSRASSRLRASGKIPGVVYGHGIDALSVAVDARALRAALTTEAGTNVLLNIEVDGDSHLAMAKAVQRHPTRGTVVHVDFQVVRRDEIVTRDVNVHLVGEATEVHKGDGVVDQQQFALTVQATPALIPTQIEVDVSALAIGDTIRVADITLPEGVSTELDPETPIVVGQPPQVTAADLETEADAEAAEAAEGEAAEGADGEAAEGQGAEGAPAEGEAPADNAEG